MGAVTHPLRHFQLQCYICVSYSVLYDTRRQMQAHTTGWGKQTGREEGVRDKAGLEQTELKAAQISVVPHRVFMEKKDKMEMTSVKKWGKKIQPLLSSECNSYEGFVEKQVFPPWKSRAASSWQAFFFFFPFFVFRLHIWNSQCIVSEGETKLNIVANTSMCGSANLDNDIVGFFFTLWNKQRISN